MAKITLDTALTDYGAAKLNANFQKIANEFNNKVMYRDNPEGEPNTPTKDQDYNGKNMFNIGEARVTSLLVNGTNVLTAVGDIGAAKTAAETAAANSQASAVTSAGSATASAGYASQAGVYAGQAASAVSATTNVADYAALRAYVANNTTIINVTGYLVSAAPSGIAGVFVRDDNDVSSADNGGTIIVASNGKRWKRQYDGLVSLDWFDAKGNGSTDDRAAVQAWVNFLTTNHVHGFAPAGNYRLVGKVDITGTYGWGVIGAGQEATVFTQATDNVPVFDLGGVSGPGMHSYVMTDFALDYTNNQPSTNTDANPLKFSQMGYEGELNRITFRKGSWAIKVQSGIGGPWGQHWDNLNFGGSLTGGCMDWTGATNAVPNNHWGRFFVTATNMVGPIFKQIKGYNWTWDLCELLAGTNCQWIDSQAGAQINLGAIKMEICNYSGAPSFLGNALMYFPGGDVDIGQIHIGGTTATFAFSADRAIISGGTGGNINVKQLHTALTASPTQFYLANLNGGNSEINYRRKGSFPVPYTNVVSSAGSDNLTVLPDKNDKISANKGDADYTITAGDPAHIRFETTLTAVRTVNLPADNTCFNGLRYRVISSGAVNGSNTILVKASGNTKATLSADKTFIDLVWRRNAVPHNGWLIVASGTLP